MESKDALVSIVIPCYNAEKYINKCFQSIFEQDYERIELIVVNDGSTDGSEELILKWKERIENKGYVFQYLYQSNQGQAKATGNALKYVTGKYITLIDADDYFLQGSIKKRAEFLDKHKECSVVRSNGWLQKKDSRALFVENETEKNITDLFTALIKGETNNWAGTYMVRSDALFAAYPERKIFDSPYGQNIQILLPVAYKNKSGFIDEPLMVYVQHENSHSQAEDAKAQFQKEEDNAWGYREIYIHMIDFLVKDTKENRYYKNEFDASFFRCAMLRALKNEKIQLMKKYYQSLCQTGNITLNDKIHYYTKQNKTYAIMLKIVRKIKRMVGI